MPIRTILVHMATDPHHGNRLRVGQDLARRFGAHLDVLFTLTPAHLPAGATGRGASYAYIAEATDIARKKAAEVEHEIRRACADLPYRWMVEEGDPVDLLATRSELADLAVVSQHRPDNLEERIHGHMPNDFVRRSACPVLVLPEEGRTEPPVGRNVLLAWKPTREASRVVRDSLALLQAADRVVLLTIVPPDEEPTRTGEIREFLARMGVKVEPHVAFHEGHDVGPIILAEAEALGCDSVVMGAFGSAGILERIMGRVTNHVLHHAELPVILAH